MINLTQSRAYCHTAKFRCRWIKRNELGKNDNETLNYQKRGTLFFASEINDRALGTNEIEDAFSVPFETKALQTTDNVDGMKKNDLVICDGQTWIVDQVKTTRLRTTSQYLENRRTLIALRK